MIDILNEVSSFMKTVLSLSIGLPVIGMFLTWKFLSYMKKDK